MESVFAYSDAFNQKAVAARTEELLKRSPDAPQPSAPAKTTSDAGQQEDKARRIRFVTSPGIFVYVERRLIPGKNPRDMFEESYRITVPEGQLLFSGNKRGALDYFTGLGAYPQAVISFLDNLQRPSSLEN